MPSNTAVEELRVSDHEAGPYGIVTGPDGALWYTMVYAGRIGRITREGAISRYELPTPSSEPHGITLGPDGALWIALETGRLARLRPPR